MTHLLIIFCAAGLVYLCRLSGFVLPFAKSSVKGSAIWHAIPILVFSALVATPLVHDPSNLPPQVGAFLLTGFIVRRTHQTGLAILLGFGLFYLLSSL